MMMWEEKYLKPKATDASLGSGDIDQGVKFNPQYHMLPAV